MLLMMAQWQMMMKMMLMITNTIIYCMLQIRTVFTIMLNQFLKNINCLPFTFLMLFTCRHWFYVHCIVYFFRFFVWILVDYKSEKGKKTHTHTHWIKNEIKPKIPIQLWTILTSFRLLSLYHDTMVKQYTLFWIAHTRIFR